MKSRDLNFDNVEKFSNMEWSARTGEDCYKLLLKCGIIEIEVKTMEKEEVKIASEVAS